MGWLPIFKRKPTGNERTGASGRAPRDSAPRSAAATADTVQQARTRARRRLIGAAVLVVAGIIGFPLLFETQPRPVAVDIPIEIPRKEGSPALAMPASRAPQPVATAPSAAPPPVITETAADAGREVTRPVAVSRPPSAASTIAAVRPASPASRPTAVADLKPPAPPPPTRVADAERASALLDGRLVVKPDTKPAPPASAASGPGRFIVQAGAFADAAAARDTRVKLERLGLKTYTQVADTAAGPRVRVRLGPFASKADADKALAKAKAAGLAAVVITL